ncbi:MAG: phosphate acyltransferase PlsX [Elusimicrobiota bacterium]|jgi:glycerol-3-phosphate acyltransferase PlsX|nr:phosphate acyltransferase PlsX [Elusimicrobiota bacterium]
MIIALDAMGGDEAPQSTVEGAVLAAKQLDAKILLVGNEKLIIQELLKHQKRHSVSSLDIEILNASEVIAMDEHPAKAIRNKKDSSLSICAKIAGEGKADAFISMGNSGAVMAAALFYLKRIESVLRPAIATPFPTATGHCIIADAGANMDCKPEHLFQFAVMAESYSRVVMGIENPKVGLVSIGEEETKGNELTLAAYKMLKKADLNFIGNIEGRDISKGAADVVVCDGFVGNVILKFGEGLAEMMLKLVKKGFKDHPIAWASLPFLWLAVRDLMKKVDYSEMGGVPLLGVNGVCIIGHGRSNAKAVKNALIAGANAVKHNFKNSIEEALKHSPL